MHLKNNVLKVPSELNTYAVDVFEKEEFFKSYMSDRFMETKSSAPLQ